MALIRTLQGVGEFKEIGLKVKYSFKISDAVGHPGKLHGEGTVESTTANPLPDFTGKRFLLTLEDGSCLHLSFAYPKMFYVVSGQ